MVDFLIPDTDYFILQSLNGFVSLLQQIIELHLHFLDFVVQKLTHIIIGDLKLIEENDSHKLVLGLLGHHHLLKQASLLSWNLLICHLLYHLNHFIWLVMLQSQHISEALDFFDIVQSHLGYLLIGALQLVPEQHYLLCLLLFLIVYARIFHFLKLFKQTLRNM